MNEIDEAQVRLEQRVLAIPGVTLVARFDPAEETSPPAPSPKGGEGWKVPARDLLFSRVWLGFGMHDDQAEAERMFEKKIGHKPEFVYLDLAGKMLWVGPV